MKLTNQQRIEQIKAIEEAVSIAGGISQLAKQLTAILKRPKSNPVTYQNVYDLVNVCCAAHWAIPIEKATGVSRSKIHPIAYPPEDYAA